MPIWFIPIFKLLLSEVVSESASVVSQVIRDAMGKGQVVFQFPVQKEVKAYVAIQRFIMSFNIETYTVSKDKETMSFCFPGVMSDKYRAFFVTLIKED